jgi:hypothetical protein
MPKVKTFVSFHNVTSAGAKRVLYRTAITPNKDSVTTDNVTQQTAAQVAGYLNALATANTLYPPAPINPTLLADLQAKVTSLIQDATTASTKLGMKVYMGPSTLLPEVGAFFLTVKTPTGKQKFEYVLAD